MRGNRPGLVSIVVASLLLGLFLSQSLGLAPALAQEKAPQEKSAQEKPAQDKPPEEKPAQPLPTPSKPVAPDNSIISFVQANPDCTELTDECIICAVVSGKAMCSTPGIACIRKELRCVTTKPATPKQ